MEQTYDQVLDDANAETKRAYWDVAFGLQAVDNLKPSEYVRHLADEHVHGEKTYRQVTELTREYYERQDYDAGEREADEVAEAIYDILHDAAFRFDVATLKSYHRRLFRNMNAEVYHPGEFRKVNLTKKEAVLSGDTVQYQDYGLIEDSLKYDFEEEAGQNYLGMSEKEKVERLAEFTSRIWQVHPFYEGNTRTTAVFIEKYLMSLGYAVDNEFFKEHSKEFRDALVLANYSNIPKGIQADRSRLNEMFREFLEK